jgi:hypothetical protein
MSARDHFSTSELRLKSRAAEDAPDDINEILAGLPLAFHRLFAGECREFATDSRFLRCCNLLGRMRASSIFSL